MSVSIFLSLSFRPSLSFTLALSLTPLSSHSSWSVTFTKLNDVSTESLTGISLVSLPRTVSLSQVKYSSPSALEIVTPSFIYRVGNAMHFIGTPIIPLIVRDIVIHVFVHFKHSSISLSLAVSLLVMQFFTE